MSVLGLIFFAGANESVMPPTQSIHGMIHYSGPCTPEAYLFSATNSEKHRIIKASCRRYREHRLHYNMYGVCLVL
jgi:hypothetical protein